MSVFAIAPFEVGAQSTSADFAQLLGQRYLINGKWYKLVQNGTGSTLAKNSVLVMTFTLGVPINVVNNTTVANDVNVCGFVPSAYTTAVATSAYFLMQISGAISPLTGTTTLVTTALSVALGTATIGGRVQEAYTITQKWDMAACGITTNTAAVTVGVAAPGVIMGLFDKF